MQTDIHAEPIHQKILVPLGASIALTAAVLAAAAIALIVRPTQGLGEAVTEGSLAAIVRSIGALLLDAFWWLVNLL